MNRAARRRARTHGPLAAIAAFLIWIGAFGYHSHARSASELPSAHQPESPDVLTDVHGKVITEVLA